MPSQINRVPPGLLSLLGIKALGQNPSVLNDTVQPTVDLIRWYLSIYSQLETSDVAVGAVGIVISTTLRAGPGEMLILDGAASFTLNQLPATTEYRYQLAVAEIVTGRVCQMIGERSATGVATDLVSSGASDFVVMPPGYGLCVLTERYINAPAPTVRIASRVLRLTV